MRCTDHCPPGSGAAGLGVALAAGGIAAASAALAAVLGDIVLGAAILAIAVVSGTWLLTSLPSVIERCDSCDIWVRHLTPWGATCRTQMSQRNDIRPLRLPARQIAPNGDFGYGEFSADLTERLAGSS